MVRLTPDIYRGADAEQAGSEVARTRLKYRDRGIVGARARWPRGGVPAGARTSRRSTLAKAGGPRLGAACGRGRGAALGARRARGARRRSARARDPRGRGPGLVAERRIAGSCCDVCPLSNLRTGAVPSLAEHPLPQLVAAGVRCSISTDDPAMFETDLTRDYEAAATLGAHARAAYEARASPARCAARRRGSASPRSPRASTGAGDTDPADDRSSSVDTVAAMTAPDPLPSCSMPAACSSCPSTTASSARSPEPSARSSAEMLGCPLPRRRGSTTGLDVEGDWAGCWRVPRAYVEECGVPTRTARRPTATSTASSPTPRSGCSHRRVPRGPAGAGRHGVRLGVVSNADGIMGQRLRHARDPPGRPRARGRDRVRHRLGPSAS